MARLETSRADFDLPIDMARDTSGDIRTETPRAGPVSGELCVWVRAGVTKEAGFEYIRDVKLDGISLSPLRILWIFRYLPNA